MSATADLPENLTGATERSMGIFPPEKHDACRTSHKSTKFAERKDTCTLCLASLPVRVATYRNKQWLRSRMRTRMWPRSRPSRRRVSFVKLSFAQHSWVRRRIEHMHAGTHASRFNLLDGIELNEHPSFVEMDLLRNMKLYLHACLGCAVRSKLHSLLFLQHIHAYA